MLGVRQRKYTVMIRIVVNADLMYASAGFLGYSST